MFLVHINESPCCNFQPQPSIKERPKLRILNWSSRKNAERIAELWLLYNNSVRYAISFSCYGGVLSHFFVRHFTMGRNSAITLFYQISLQNVEVNACPLQKNLINSNTIILSLFLSQICPVFNNGVITWNSR